MNTRRCDLIGCIYSSECASPHTAHGGISQLSKMMMVMMMSTKHRAPSLPPPPSPFPSSSSFSSFSSTSPSPSLPFPFFFSLFFNICVCPHPMNDAHLRRLCVYQPLRPFPVWLTCDWSTYLPPSSFSPSPFQLMTNETFNYETYAFTSY